MNQQAAEVMRTVLQTSHPVRIKLLGDSITHGVGGSGFAQNGEPIVDDFARNPDGYCWANRFAAYMREHYGATVVNNACSGTRVEFILHLFDTLVDADDDLIVCMIGTNNRHQFFEETPQYSREEFENNLYQLILALDDRLRTTGKPYILMANIPASAGNEEDGNDYRRLLHMDDIHRLYTKAAKERGFAFVPLYPPFTAYCEAHDLPIDALLADGLHPNNTGYDVMYDLLMDAFGLISYEDKPVYSLRFWFEHGGGCLWGKNRDAKTTFGYKVRYQDLPLSDTLKDRLAALETRYATYLDWSDPASPSPWTREEKQAFINDADAVYQALCDELGNGFVIENQSDACISL